MSTVQKSIFDTRKKYGIPGRKEVLAYANNFCRQLSDEQCRVIIFGQGRSGSTLLESLFCSTGHFDRQGELLNIMQHGEIRRPISYVNGLAKWAAPSNFIFHAKIYQLTSNRRVPLNEREFLRDLAASNWRIVYLRRENVIRQCISNFIAQKRNQAHKRDKLQEVIRLHVDCAELERRVNGRLGFLEAEKIALAGLKFEEVIYERDLEDSLNHQPTIDRCLKFLSLENRPVSTSLHRINRFPLSEIVENYDELMNCLQKNGWESYDR